MPYRNPCYIYFFLEIVIYVSRYYERNGVRVSIVDKTLDIMSYKHATWKRVQKKLIVYQSCLRSRVTSVTFLSAKEFTFSVYERVWWIFRTLDKKEFLMIIRDNFCWMRYRAWFVRLHREIHCNTRALARGLSAVQAHKPCSISLVPWYPVYTLHIAEYLVLKIGYLWIVVQDRNMLWPLIWTVLKCIETYVVTLNRLDETV